MRAKEKQKPTKEPYSKPPPNPKRHPTVHDMAVKAVSLFNPGGDKTAYIAYMSKFSPTLKAAVIKEMQVVWAKQN